MTADPARIDREPCRRAAPAARRALEGPRRAALRLGPAEARPAARPPRACAACPCPDRLDRHERRPRRPGRRRGADRGRPPDHRDRHGSAEPAARSHRGRLCRRAGRAGRRADARRRGRWRGARPGAARRRCRPSSTRKRRWSPAPSWPARSSRPRAIERARWTPRRTRASVARATNRSTRRSSRTTSPAGIATGRATRSARSVDRRSRARHRSRPRGSTRATSSRTRARRGSTPTGRWSSSHRRRRCSRSGTRSPRRSGSSSDRCAPSGRRWAAAFGGKWPLFDTLAAAAAWKLRRPVRLAATRTEDFAATNPGQPYATTISLSADAEGRFTHLGARIVTDAGAFEEGSAESLAGVLVAGPYAWPAVDIKAYGVRTNRFGVGAYRAPSAPQMAFAIETTVDEVAAALGLDPIELRRRNLSTAGGQMVDGEAWAAHGAAEVLDALEATATWRDRANRGDGRGRRRRARLLAGRDRTRRPPRAASRRTAASRS